MRAIYSVMILSLVFTLACSDDSDVDPDGGQDKDGAIVDVNQPKEDGGGVEDTQTPRDQGQEQGQEPPKDSAIVFLHHSTGGVIWGGGVADAVSAHNDQHGTSYAISEQEFPKSSPYGWENYPYDYWHIWVENAGDGPFMEEPTLEMLTQQYQVIVWKHCYPVSGVEEDTGNADVASSTKSVENYKLQYAALKEKMKAFPEVRFVVWTGAALVENETNAAEAGRARDFSEWVKSSWDEAGDNIFVWDFRQLETSGGLYLENGNAADEWDSHPNDTFAKRVAPLLAKRVIDVIEGRGDTGSLTGE